MSLWFIHDWLLNIDIGLIYIELLIDTDVNRKLKEMHVENAYLFSI